MTRGGTPGAPDRTGLDGHEEERLRLRLTGVGAMASPRFAPAGLLVAAPTGAILIDGGPDTLPGAGAPAAWLVTDTRAELIGQLRRAAGQVGLHPEMTDYTVDGLEIAARPVVHTSHPSCGYLLRWRGRTAVWAPEFLEFPEWAGGCDLMFADAAGWSRPIRFRGGVGGHAPVLLTAAAARRAGVRRLVFAHIGRPTLRAVDAGALPPYGELGREGCDYYL